MTKENAIKRAKNQLAYLLMNYVYLGKNNDIKKEWIIDILTILRDKIDYEIKVWEREEAG